MTLPGVMVVMTPSDPREEMRPVRTMSAVQREVKSAVDRFRGYAPPDPRDLRTKVNEDLRLRFAALRECGMLPYGVNLRFEVSVTYNPGSPPDVRVMVLGWRHTDDEIVEEVMES